MKLFKKAAYRILLISSLFLILAICISYMVYSYNKTIYVVCGNQAPVFFCGTPTPNYTEKASKGKQVFNANCASCHKLHKRITGPALAKTDSTLFWNWLTQKNSKLNKVEFNKMGMDYHKNLWGKTLTQNEISELYEYINIK